MLEKDAPVHARIFSDVDEDDEIEHLAQGGVCHDQQALDQDVSRIVRALKRHIACVDVLPEQLGETIRFFIRDQCI
jgi:hypothetical protein